MRENTLVEYSQVGSQHVGEREVFCEVVSSIHRGINAFKVDQVAFYPVT